MTVFGWDCSDFDWSRGPMDFQAAAADGISFMTHKATEGTGVKHVRYREALERARAAGIPFLGAYIVIRSGPVQPQVDYFLSYLDSATPWWRAMPEFFLQVDLEDWPYDHVAASQGITCAELLRQQSGKWVVLYAPQWAYGNTIGGSDPLWASAYGANPAIHYRDAYPGDGDGKRWQAYSGRTPTFLQYGSTTIIGTQPTCDANAFRGTLADLRQLITGSAEGNDDMSAEAEIYAYNASAIAFAMATGADAADCQWAWTGDGHTIGDHFSQPLDGFWSRVGGSGGGAGPTLAEIEKAVDRQLDQQSLGGADKD